MKDSSEWQVPKWPFLISNAALLALAGALIFLSARLDLQTAIVAACCGMAGALLGCLPFILEYRAVKKLLEINALGSVAGKFADAEKLTAQVAEATDRWSRIQDALRSDSEKTAGAAREIAERMAAEVRDFNEFQTRMNDAEKTATRLEVEKLRRAEGEWIQVVARILDHVFALHGAAVRSGQTELAEQVGQFQHACRDTTRRIGLAQFESKTGEKFDPQKHRIHGAEQPAGDAVVAELLAPGLTFQGRMLRPALVRLAESIPPGPETTANIEDTGTGLKPTSDNP